MNIHHMSLQNQYFCLIKQGKKSIELRLWDDKRKKIKVGDIIVFHNVDSAETILETKVVQLYFAADFQELSKITNIKQTGFNDTATMLQTLEKIYPLSQQKKYQVVGIEIQLMKKT